MSRGRRPGEAACTEAWHVRTAAMHTWFSNSASRRQPSIRSHSNTSRLPACAAAMHAPMVSSPAFSWPGAARAYKNCKSPRLPVPATRLKMIISRVAVLPPYRARWSATTQPMPVAGQRWRVAGVTCPSSRCLLNPGSCSSHSSRATEVTTAASRDRKRVPASGQGLRRSLGCLSTGILVPQAVLPLMVPLIVLAGWSSLARWSVESVQVAHCMHRGNRRGNLAIYAGVRSPQHTHTHSNQVSRMARARAGWGWVG